MHPDIGFWAGILAYILFIWAFTVHGGRLSIVDVQLITEKTHPVARFFISVVAYPLICVFLIALGEVAKNLLEPVAALVLRL